MQELQQLLRLRKALSLQVRIISTCELMLTTAW